LWLNTTTNQIFAALGSDVNMPQPVKTLHIASHDGILRWVDLMVEETGDPGSTDLLDGEFTSVRRIDMNGDGVISGLDIDPLKQVLGGVLTRYMPAGDLFGLDGRARGDANNDGLVSGLDIDPAKTCLGGGACPTVIPPAAGAGAGIATAGVPEPASAVLFLLGALVMGSVRRNRR
jgi:hypothetical protein